MLNNFSSGLTSTQDSDYTSKPCIATSTAILQGLDKITGRVVTVETTVDLDVFFGTLSIRVLKCLKTRPNDISDSAAYLVIQEHKPTSINAILFKGWMLATHPSLSSLEHPVYDIWVKSCVDDQIQDKSTRSSLSINKTANLNFDKNNNECPITNYSQKPIASSHDTAHNYEIPPVLGPTAKEQQQLDALYRGIEHPNTL